MKSNPGFIKATIVGGFTVILPITLVVIMFQQIIGTLIKLLQPIAEWLPVSEQGEKWIAYIAALLIVLGFCFLTGLFVQARLGALLKNRFESLLLERLPGYTMLKNLTQRVTGVEGIQYAPAVVDLYGSGARVLALIVEAHGDGSYTVFVPTSPTPTLGQVYLVPGERVHRSSANLGAVIDGLTRWGDKSGKLFDIKA